MYSISIQIPSRAGASLASLGIDVTAPLLATLKINESQLFQQVAPYRASIYLKSVHAAGARTSYNIKPRS